MQSPNLNQAGTASKAAETPLVQLRFGRLYRTMLLPKVLETCQGLLWRAQIYQLLQQLTMLNFDNLASQTMVIASQ